MKKLFKIILLITIILVVCYLIFIQLAKKKMIVLPCYQDQFCPAGMMCVDMGKGGYLCASGGECSLCPSGKCTIREKYPPVITCTETNSKESSLGFE